MLEKKKYSGLDVEVILFGTDTIETTLLAESGCYLGSVQFYTTDGENRPMPIGVCWVQETGKYSFVWAEYRGDFIPYP